MHYDLLLHFINWLTLKAFVLSSNIYDTMVLFYYLKMFNSLTKEKKHSILNIEDIWYHFSFWASPWHGSQVLIGATRTTSLAKNDLGSRVTSGLMADIPLLFLCLGTMNHITWRRISIRPAPAWEHLCGKAASQETTECARLVPFYWQNLAAHIFPFLD